MIKAKAPSPPRVSPPILEKEKADKDELMGDDVPLPTKAERALGTFGEKEKKVLVDEKTFGTPKRKIEPKVVKQEDFVMGFTAAMLGAQAFIHRDFKESLAKVLKESYKMEIKDWQPLLNVWEHYNRGLMQLYLTKTLEILSLPAGMKLEIQQPSTDEPKKPKTSSLPLF